MYLLAYCIAFVNKPGMYLQIDVCTEEQFKFVWKLVHALIVLNL